MFVLVESGTEVIGHRRGKPDRREAEHTCTDRNDKPQIATAEQRGRKERGQSRNHAEPMAAEQDR